MISVKRADRLLLTFALCVSILMPTSWAQNAPAGQIIGVGNFSHIVTSLEKSVEFYRDVIGLGVELIEYKDIELIQRP